MISDRQKFIEKKIGRHVVQDEHGRFVITADEFWRLEGPDPVSTFDRVSGVVLEFAKDNPWLITAVGFTLPLLCYSLY